MRAATAGSQAAAGAGAGGRRHAAAALKPTLPRARAVVATAVEPRAVFRYARRAAPLARRRQPATATVATVTAVAAVAVRALTGCRAVGAAVAGTRTGSTLPQGGQVVATPAATATATAATGTTTAASSANAGTVGSSGGGAGGGGVTAR